MLDAADLAKRMGCHKATLSEDVTSASRTFKKSNRAQTHGWNRAKGKRAKAHVWNRS